MSHHPTIHHATDMHGAAPRAKVAFKLVCVASVAAVIVSVLTATALSRSAATAGVPDSSVAPAALLSAAASPWSSVLGAGADLDSEDPSVQERAPAF